MRAKEKDSVRIKQEIKKEGLKRARSQTKADEEDDEVMIASEGQTGKRQRSSRDSGVEVVDLTD